jgi:hypothetical protein
MGRSALGYVPTVVTICADTQKVIEGFTDTQTAWRCHKHPLMFSKYGNRLKIENGYAEGRRRRTENVFVVRLGLTGIQRKLCVALYSANHLAVSRAL